MGAPVLYVEVGISCVAPFSTLGAPVLYSGGTLQLHTMDVAFHRPVMPRGKMGTSHLEVGISWVAPFSTRWMSHSTVPLTIPIATSPPSKKPRREDTANGFGRTGC